MENIEQFRQTVRELVETYKNKNNAKPEKIKNFQDGVSKSQFHKVLRRELGYLERTIFDDTYKLIVIP